MEKALVFLHYGGKWVENNEYRDFEVVGILVPLGCTFDGLVDIIFSELQLDRTRVEITIRYQVKKGIPLVKIVNNNSVSFYLELKRKDQDISSFPLCIDAIPISESSTDDTLTNIQILQSAAAALQRDDMLQLQLRETENSITQAEQSIEDIASEVYECIPEFEEVNNEAHTSVISDTNADRIVENQIFRDKDVLKTSISKYAIRNKFQYRVKKSDKREFVLACSDDNCGWTFRASKVGSTNLFKIRYIRNGHTCLRDIILGDHRQASSVMVAHCIKHKYTSMKTIYTPADIMNDMMNDYGVSMSYDKAWRARERAIVMLRGDPDESYERLPTYMHMLEVTNPGSITRVETDSNKKFKYLFIAFGASVQGWEFCRPVIVVNGTCLKGWYGGTLFTACTQDANNNIFVLSFGVADSKYDDSWEWFMNMMKEAYGEREGLCIVSDIHANIEKAVQKVYPNVMHAICSYHLLHNLKSTFGQDAKNVMQAFNAAARAYTKNEFEYQMAQLDIINKEIRRYLENVGYHRWSRAYMTTNSFSTMTSNIVESVNTITKAAKKLPINALLECIRHMLQKWSCKNRENAMVTFTHLATRQENILKERSIDLMKMEVIASSPGLYQVHCNNGLHLVNIEERTCSCNRFQMDEMPCAHALAVIAKEDFNSYDYCSRYYTKSSYIATYRGTIFSLGNRADWTTPDDVAMRKVLPPNPRKKPRRPKEKQTRSESEEGEQATRCGRCKEYGHNRRTCNNPLPSKPKPRKKRKQQDSKVADVVQHDAQHDE